MNQVATAESPFAIQGSTGNVETAQAREVAAVHGAMVMARRFPRDVQLSTGRILDMCSDPNLAEVSMYAYTRGGTQVEGPSIRLAEVMAQCWGNMRSGIRELSQQGKFSSLEAYAWDLETNYYMSKQFEVEHVRYTRKGKTQLSDPRDIYEMGANLGARRMRACILAVIPKHVTDAAVRQCYLTLENAIGAPGEAIEQMAKAFMDEFKVTTDMLQQRMQKPLRSALAIDVLRLKQIFQSMRDGISKPADWFDLGSSQGSKDLTSAMKQPPKGKAS